jgi:hypothetical protein
VVGRGLGDESLKYLSRLRELRPSARGEERESEVEERLRVLRVGGEHFAVLDDGRLVIARVEHRPRQTRLRGGPSRGVGLRHHQLAEG